MSKRGLEKMEISEILYRWFIKGISRNKISETLGYSKNTVSRYIKSGKSEGLQRTSSSIADVERVATALKSKSIKKRQGSCETESLISQYNDFISDHLDEKYMTRKQLYKLLCEQHKISFSYASFNRYILKHFGDNKPCATVVMHSKPGHQAILNLPLKFGRIGFCKIQFS